jgi:hypothetical protein
MARLRILAVTAFWASLACLGTEGQVYGQDRTEWFHPNQQVRVANLPSLVAPSGDPSAVLVTALATALHDPAVCCGKDSALEDTAFSEPRSLKELGAKSQGRHRLSDGLPIIVDAEYVPASSITAAIIVGVLQDQHAPLIEWQSHFYVLYGAVFNEAGNSSGERQYIIVKLLLLDPRFSGRRREVVFDNEADDPRTLQGMLKVAVARR